MPDIVFLTIEQAFDLHDQALAEFGGSPGVLNVGLIDSAVAMPRATFGGHFLHEGNAAMAAAYFFHLCQAHGFQDGKKRTAVWSSLLFLEGNEHSIDASNDELYDLAIQVADHKVLKEHVTEFFQSRVRQH